MKPLVDDLPEIKASELRSAGLIDRDTLSTIIKFPGSDVEHVVAVAVKLFPKTGGYWMMFRCQCGRRCQKLRLFEGRAVCTACVHAGGMKRYRLEMQSHAGKRAAITAARRIALLNSDKPLRVNPRPGRTLDRRIPMEAKLRRSIIVARKFAFSGYEKA